MIVWGQENIFIVLAVYLHLINKREYASAGKKILQLKYFTFCVWERMNYDSFFLCISEV